MSQSATTSSNPSDAVSPGPKKGALVIVFLTVMIDLMGFGLMMPLMSLIARDYGASDATAGMLLATYSLMQLICAPLLGRLSDRIGRRPVILLGLLGSCVSWTIFATAGSLVMLFVARALAGAFGATVQTAQAYVADVTTPETRARGMGMIGAAFGIGYVIGPVIGALLIKSHGSAPAYFAAGLSFTAFLFGLTRLPESRRPDAAPRKEQSGILRLALSDPRRALLLPLYFLMIYCFANFESRFTPFGVDVQGFDRSQMLWIVSLVGFFVAMIQGGSIKKMVKRLGERPLFILGAILFAAGYFLLAIGRSHALFFVASALIGLGQGFSSPTIMAMISKSTPAENQGAVFGVQAALSSLGRVLGHPLSGRIYMVSPSLPFYISAAILVLVAAIVATSSALRGLFGKPAESPA